MADENISIEITDKVAPGIATKIRAIGDESTKAFPAVEKLKAALKAIDVSAVTKLQKALEANTNAIAKQQLQAQRLQTEQQRTATASAKLAAAQNQAATGAAQLAAAQSRAASAAAQVAAAQDRAALAALRLADAQQRQADRAAAATARTQANALAAANAATEAAKLAAAGNKAATATDKYTMSAKAQAAAMRGVPAQITDIVVSLQGGQRPLTVLLQQGGQLKDMFGGVVPALRALAAGFIAMINPVTVLLAAFVAFGAVMAMVESRMRTVNATVAQFVATGRGNIDGSFIVSLRKELEQLPGISRSAADATIKAFADVRSVGAANLTAASKLVADFATATGTDVPKAAEAMAKALDDPLKGAIDLDKQLGFLTVSQFKSIDAFMKQGKTAQAQKVLIDALSGAIGGLTNDSMTPMQKATDKLGNAWNKFTGELQNSAPIQAATGLLISLINALTKLLERLNDMGSWKPPAWVQSMMDNGPNSWIGDKFAGMFGGSKGKSDLPASTAITGTPIPARPRTPEQLKPTKFKTDAAGITGEHKKDAENRATALLKINTQLDNEFKQLSMLGPEREKQQKFDQIEEGLISKKIKLNDAERDSIKAKIAAIVDNTAVSQAMGRIFDEVKGPQLEWNATITASDKLLQAGKITQEEYNRVMLKGEEAITNIKNPLREFMKDLNEQLTLSKMTTEQAAIESQIMKVRNDLLAKGIELTDKESESIRAKLKLIQESNLAQQAENALLDQSVNKRRDFANQLTAINKLRADSKSGFTSGDASMATNDILKGMGLDTANLQIGTQAHVETFRNMYAQIDQLRQQNLIGEQDASNLRTQIWIKEQEGRLSSAQGFFGSLASLQGSSNKKLAAIGKAAAITNAIIDTYKSATGAYAAMSSIPFVGPALGAAAAAAAIAAGMANVSAIRSQGSGFKAGGYTGDIPTNQVAGPVHGREFVFDAASTARIGKENLEGMRRGTATAQAVAPAGASAASPQGSGSGVRIVNVLDPAMVGDFLGTPEGEQLFVNTIRKNADQVRSAFNNA